MYLTPGPDVIATKRCVLYNNRCALRAAAERAYHCWAPGRIETVVPTAAQVFMNERDALASGMLGRAHSQVQNYTFGILSTVPFEHGYSTRQLGEAAERGAGRRQRACVELSYRDEPTIPPSQQLIYSRRGCASCRHVPVANFRDL